MAPKLPKPAPDKVRPFACVECEGLDQVLVGGNEIYPHRADLHAKKFWRCRCGAYVGCHPNTNLPLGRPAKAETHAARRAAHAALDPLWEAKMRTAGINKHHARGKAYKWLAGELGIERKDCHIGHFDAATARRAVQIITDARTALRRGSAPSPPAEEPHG